MTLRLRLTAATIMCFVITIMPILVSLLVHCISVKSETNCDGSVVLCRSL